MKAKVTKKERVFDGFFKVDQFNIKADKHGGGTHDLIRLNFERGHAVTVLGYDPIRDEVLLVNEMRSGILAANEDPYEDALPAGAIDEGETAIEAGKREMEEETGVTINTLETIHAGAYVSPGGTSEKISIIMAIVDMSKAGGIHGKEEEGESIKTVIMKSDEFISKVQKSELKDMKTALAGHWLLSNKERLQSKYGLNAKKVKKSNLSR